MVKRDKGPSEPDLILPSQFVGTSQREAPIKQGEHQLLMAVLEDAIHCYQKHLHAKTKNEQQLFRDAEQWMLGSAPTPTCHDGKRNPGLSFENVCDLLGINAEYLRAGLRRWRDSQRPAADKDDGGV